MDQQQHKKMEQIKAYQSAMWLIIVALYFVISFTTHAWYITWLIFLVGAALQQLLKAALTDESIASQPPTREERQHAYTSALWLIIVILYFVISFTTRAWYITWIIFLIGGAVSSIVKVNIK